MFSVFLIVGGSEEYDYVENEGGTSMYSEFDAAVSTRAVKSDPPFIDECNE